MGGRTVGSPSHMLRTTFTVKRAANDACLKITYSNGKAYECGAPTQGRTYCPSCSRQLITLTDRPAPQTQRAANHPWTEEGIQRATRAKKRA